MEWNNSHKNPPKQGQKVYYFGPHIGIGIGHYAYEEGRHFYPYFYEHSMKLYEDKKVELCPHTFKNVDFGFVDACDAPFWLPYDEERAKGWCPIIPTEYVKGLYD